MHEHGLAKELMPQVRKIAADGGFEKVTRVDMVVGSLHGVVAEFLAHSFEHAFEGTVFEGAAVNITIVDPGGALRPPGATGEMTADGWELMITGIEGQRGRR